MSAVEYAAVAVAVVASVGSIAGAIVTGRGNRTTVHTERTLPPYEALAKRVGELEGQVRKEWKRSEELEDRTECMEDKLDTLHADLAADREWIKRVIAVAARRDALDHIQPLPGWYDPHTDTARQRRSNP